MTAPRRDIAKEIAWPLLYGGRERNLYNNVLEGAVQKIKRIVANDPTLKGESFYWVRRLQSQIQDNNYYVKHQRERCRTFSLVICVGMGDIVGFKFLLRVGEDPNVVDGRYSILHRAAARGHIEMVKALLQCPTLDLTSPTNARAVARLAKDPEIKALLKA